LGVLSQGCARLAEFQTSGLRRARLPFRNGQILVGTSSWTDKTLIESGKFYPPSAKTPQDRLRYYASQFPIVEIDSSYYGLPTEENAVRWVERTPPDFVFNIKTYRRFTLHQTPVISLPKHLREALGPIDSKNVYDKDVPEEIKHELWADFRRVLEILRDAGKLGAVHMQFAPWVAFHPENFEHLEFCRAMLAGFDVAIEFRNKTWFDTEKHTARTLEFERENGFVNVVVDAPQGIAKTIPSVWEVTNPALAIVRLHGRNHGTWNKKGLKASSSRFDYDYRDEELEQIAGEVKQLAPKATVHVLFNNNYQDQGQRGAAALTALLN
jgi:uncharacterized protein YecE (DUF72 family)